jgi:type IV/VI secretion system ImpK/VasF family protein
MAPPPGPSPHYDLLLKLQPWLDAVVELYADDPAGGPGPLRDRCRDAVLAVQAALRDDKLLREKAGDLGRPLVALLDEFGARRFPGLGEWSSIQIQLFNEALLGDDVILSMERLCGERPRDDPERSFVYYLCLALGFRGRYGDVNILSDGERRLTALRLRLREALVEAGWFSATRPDDLAPLAEAPGPPAPPSAPLWPWLLAFCVFLLVLTEFVALRHLAQQTTGDVARQLMQRATQAPRTTVPSAQDPP